MTPRPQLRMVGMDFDWTIYNHKEGEPHVPAETIAVLYDLAESGVDLGLVSGRYWWEMRDSLEAAGLPWGDPFPSFVITRETFIYWVGKDAMEPDEAWNTARAAELAELTHQLCLRETEWRLRLEAAGVEPGRWWLWGDYSLEVHCPTLEKAERARQLLAEYAADLPLATTHRNRYLAHVVLATATKGGSLAHAGVSRGLRPDQVLAIGDSANDLSMLDGGHGLRSATVANGEDEIKAAVRSNGGVIAEAEASAGVGELLQDARLRGWFD